MMRQSRRLTSGKVVSKYSSRGNINNVQQLQKNNKADVARDNPAVIEPESEEVIVNARGSIDDSNYNDDDTESNASDYGSDQEENAYSEIDEIKKMDKESALAHIKKNYSNPESIICYTSISGLKDLFKILSEEEIKNALSTFETWSLMKSSRTPKTYNPFIAQHLRDVWQIDCISMKETADQNLGINYLFCAIDVFR